MPAARLTCAVLPAAHLPRVHLLLGFILGDAFDAIPVHSNPLLGGRGSAASMSNLGSQHAPAQAASLCGHALSASSSASSPGLRAAGAWRRCRACRAPFPP